VTSFTDRLASRTVRISPPAGWGKLRLGDVSAYRELLYVLVWKQLRVRYSQTVIGATWAVIQPLLTMVALTVIFGHFARLPTDGLPYSIFYLSGLLPWTYFANSVTAATNSLVDHQHVITKVYFPRILLPITAVVTGLIDFALAFGTLLLLMLFHGIAPLLSPTVLVLFLLLASASMLGVGLWFSALYASYRDVRYVVQFLVTLWMFVSPVIYPSSMIPTQWHWLYGLNPMAGVIESFRWALFGRVPPPVVLLVASTLSAGATLAGGLLYFQTKEATIADVV